MNLQSDPWHKDNPEGIATLLSALRLTLRRIAEKVETRFKVWTRPATASLIQATAADLIRTRPDLIAENAFLRQQLIALERQVKHPHFTTVDRGLLVVLASRKSEYTQFTGQP